MPFKQQINVDTDPILDGAKVVITKKQQVVREVQKKGDKREPSKPIEVIVISPDTNEVAKAKENNKSDATVTSSNKVTYSSILDARSKVDSLIL